MATTYICKCGRMVTKSTNADTTGNRDTAGCEGCPYLLPWGPFVYKESIGYVMDVHGYECRMSKNIEYDTRFFGSVTDKCSCHIHSLDFDFLTRVIAWIRESNGELFASFSPDSVRPCEYMGDGRYRMSIGCAQNKKGIAAKTAFLEQFFGPDKRRLDMTPEEEKAHILAAIEAGKEKARKGEKKKVDYIISQNLNNECLYAYYREEFWVWDRTLRKWFVSEFARDQYNKYHQQFPSYSPEDFLSCTMDFDEMADYEVPHDCLEALKACEPQKGDAEIAPCEKPTPTADSAPLSVPIASDAQPSMSRSAGAVVQKDGSDDPASPTDAAPASHADAGSATQSLSAAEPASLEAESARLAFDYSGLDDQTVADLHLAEREYAGGKKMAEMGLRRMADAVAIAHDVLCGAVVHNVDNGQFAQKEDTFRRWCESIGVGKSTAYKLLQVSKLMDNSTPREQKVLEELSPSLLYAAAKPSAPTEVVQAVKDGDITTHKQYQEAMAQLKAEREAREKAEADLVAAQQEAALDRKEREDAHEKAMHYKAECDRRAQEQQRVEGLLSAREEQLRQAKQEAQDAARTIQRKQEAIEELDEIARDRLEQIEALEKGRTIEAQVSDPEEVRRQAEALARELAATETAGLQEENRRLRSCAPAVRQAWGIVTASMNVILKEAEKAEAEDENGLNALEDCEHQLLEWWSRVSDITGRLSYGEEYDHDEN